MPKDGATGSGLYSGKLGAMKAYIGEREGTKILMGKVPKVPGNLSADELDTFELMGNYNLQPSQESIDVYNVKWLDFEAESKQSGQVCMCGLCCNYDIEVEAPQPSGKVKL